MKDIFLNIFQNRFMITTFEFFPAAYYLISFGEKYASLPPTKKWPYILPAHFDGF